MSNPSQPAHVEWMLGWQCQELDLGLGSLHPGPDLALCMAPARPSPGPAMAWAWSQQAFTKSGIGKRGLDLDWPQLDVGPSPTWPGLGLVGA